MLRGTEGASGHACLGGVPREECSGIMRENGGPPWGPTESSIVGDLLRRIMPPDEPVNLSVGRSRAASMRRSIIPKLRDIHAVAGTRNRGILRSRRAAPSWIRKSGSDHFVLRRAFFSLLVRTQETRSPRPPYAFCLRATTGSTYPGTLRGPVARTTISGSTQFDVEQALDIYYPRNDNHWITHV